MKASKALRTVLVVVAGVFCTTFRGKFVLGRHVVGAALAALFALGVLLIPVVKSSGFQTEPPQEWIAFTRDGDIWADSVSAILGDEVRLTSGPDWASSTEELATWSPGRDYIAFLSDREGGAPADIWVMQVSYDQTTGVPVGGRAQNLSKGANGEYWPQWWPVDDPNGKHRIVFEGAVPTNGATGGPGKKKTQTEQRVHMIEFGFDAISGDIMPQEPVLLVDDGGGQQRRPTWSPDGQYIAYVNDSLGSINVAKVNDTPSTSTYWYPLEGVTGGNKLKWSPADPDAVPPFDGTEIYAIAGVEGQTGKYAIPIAVGSNGDPIVDSTRPIRPLGISGSNLSWSPHHDDLGLTRSFASGGSLTGGGPKRTGIFIYPEGSNGASSDAVQITDGGTQPAWN